MTRLVTVVVTVMAITSIAARAEDVRASAADQGGAPVSACALLTKDVLAAHTPAPPANFKLMISVPPQEDKIRNGTACSFGGVTLQVNTMAPVDFEPNFGKYTPLAGAKAYFRANRNRYAELAVLSGKHVITLQMGVPDGKTPADIQPNVIALAKAILAKLK